MTHDEPAPSALANLRDVADACPHLLARGRLLRSDAPLAEDDVASYPVAWPPRTIVDLRRPRERGHEHPYDDRATVVSIPVGGRASYDMSAPDASLESLYEAMIRPPFAQRFAHALDAIAVAETPVLIHCTAGKDRTGLLVALVLEILGADREAILADYTATSAAMPAVLARFPATLAAAGYRPGAVPDHLHGTSEAAMVRALTLLVEEHGGVETWLVRSGGDPATPGRIRARLGAGPAPARGDRAGS